jgi:dynein heavy chain, axonemal
MYKEIQKELRPTPSRSHYTFNLRDLAKVIQGMLMVVPKSVPDTNALMRLWCHEASRVFRDRLVNQQDRTWYDNKMVEVLENEFCKAWAPESFVDVCWGDFLQSDTSPYVEINNMELAATKLKEFADDYTLNTNKPMDLVFFKDAIHHISRISRLLRQPRGNALLVGVGGSGRQSLTRLSSFIAEMKCFQIELTRGYGTNEFHEDLKRLLIQAGADGKPTVFLFTDTQIIKESFLEDINNILNAGEVPDLFAQDETSKIIEAVRSKAKAAGKLETKDGIYSYFVEQCRENLHCVLAFSPVGDSFRNRLRMFPSLVNCCTIDWFTEWPNDALVSVARQFLGKIDLDSDELRKSVCAVCMVIHSSVSAISVRFMEELRRYNYTTPTSYLELINLYTSMLASEREVTTKKVERYQGGCDKLASTNAMVTTLQAEIIKLQPTLLRAGQETAELIETVTKDKTAASVVQKTVEEEAAKVNLATKEANAMKDDAQKDLDEALPAFASALKALDSLDKKDITEIKSFSKPPDMVMTVMEAVCILKGLKPTWEDSKKLLNDSNFLSSLASYDKDNIPYKTIKALQKYLTNPEFVPERVQKVSAAARSLCM